MQTRNEKKYMNGFIGATDRNIFKSIANQINKYGWETELIKESRLLSLGKTKHLNSMKTFQTNTKDNLNIYVLGTIYDIFKKELIDKIVLFYKEEKFTKFSEFNGVFQIIIYDENSKKLTIINDRCGVTKCYYNLDNKGFVFSFRYLPLKNVINQKTLNKDGIYDFLRFRYVLGNNTFINEIKQAGAGSILQYNFNKNSIKIEKYWSFEYNIDSKVEINDKILKRVYDLWQGAVEKRIKNENPVIIPLSGGKDSRAILAAALEITSAQNILTYSYGHPKSYEFNIARKVAKQAGVNNIPIIPEESNFRNQFNNFYKLNDGLFNALPTLPAEGVKQIAEYGSTIISGYIGDFIFGSNLPNIILDLDLSSKDNKKIRKTFLNAVEFHSKKIVERFFNHKRNYNEIKININNEKIYNTFPQFFLENHIYNFTYHSCLTLKNLYNYKLPFLDNNLIDFMLKVPIELRKGQKLYKLFLDNYYKELFEIPLQNDFGLKMITPNWIKKLKYKYYIISVNKLNRIISFFFHINFPAKKNIGYLDIANLINLNKDYKNNVLYYLENLDSNLFNMSEIKNISKNGILLDYSYLISQLATIGMIGI